MRHCLVPIQSNVLNGFVMVTSCLGSALWAICRGLLAIFEKKLLSIGDRIFAGETILIVVPDAWLRDRVL